MVFKFNITPFAIALLLTGNDVRAVAPNSGTAAMETVPEGKAAQSTVGGGICLFMQPKDWTLTNQMDTGKLTLQLDGSWTQADSKGVIKWKVIPEPNGDLYMAASKDLRGPNNVISVIFKNSGKPYNFYIRAGQICRGQMTFDYAAEIKAKNPISEINHYQRYKVLPIMHPKPKGGQAGGGKVAF